VRIAGGGITVTAPFELEHQWAVATSHAGTKVWTGQVENISGSTINVSMWTSGTTKSWADFTIQVFKKL
jgi:hypothetical protein